MLPDLFRDPVPGFRRLFTAGVDLIVTPFCFRGHHFGHVPAVFLSQPVPPPAEGTHDQESFHLQVGQGTFKALFQRGLFPEVPGQHGAACRVFVQGKHIQDPPAAACHPAVLVHAFPVIAVPAVIGKAGEPLPGDKAGFPVKEFPVGDIRMRRQQLAPVPRVQGTAGPPVGRRGMLFHGKTGNTVGEKGQETDLPDQSEQVIGGMQAFRVGTPAAFHDPFTGNGFHTAYLLRGTGIKKAGIRFSGFPPGVFSLRSVPPGTGPAHPPRSASGQTRIPAVCCRSAGSSGAAWPARDTRRWEPERSGRRGRPFP